jgi:acetyl-CoA carboxylase alpha subunit
LFCRPEEFKRMRARRALQLLTNGVLKIFTKDAKLELRSIEEAAANQETVRLKLVRPGTKNSHIELVQLALSQVTDIQGAERGKWDTATVAAFARFQRNIGRVGKDANGIPDASSLGRLAAETKLFTVSE